MLKNAASPMLRRVVASTGARVSVVAILTIAMLASVSCETNEVEEATVGQSPTVTQRPTPEPGTVTATASPRPTDSPSTNATVTQTLVPAAKPTQTPVTDDPTQTAGTATPTATPTIAPTVTANPTAVPEVVAAAPTQTPSPTVVPTPSATQLPAATSTRSPTPSPTATQPPVPTPTPSLADVIEKASGSIVKITSRAGSGTGWIFATEDEMAYIVSNSHVLPTIHNPTVSVPNFGEYEAEVLGGDRNLDIAVIRICCSQDFVQLDIADASTLRLGDDFTSLGYPLGVDSIKVTRTILTGFNTDSTTGRKEFETDASPNAGNSGGPLITATGEVVGIITYKLEADGEATVFAISSETFSDALADLKTHPVRTIETPDNIGSATTGNISVEEGMTDPIAAPFPATSTRQAKNLFLRYNFTVFHKASYNTYLNTSWGVAFRVTSDARYVFVGIGDSGRPLESLNNQSHWMLFLERNGNRTLIDEGPESVLEFSLLITETQGWLILDPPHGMALSRRLRVLDLSDHVVPGEVHTIANYMDGDQQPVTMFYTIEAWRIAPVYRTFDQSVIQPADEKASLPGGTVSGRFIAITTFENPSAPNDAINWANGVELTQHGKFYRMVGISRGSSSLDFSVEIDTPCKDKLADVYLNPSAGASNQLIVGRTREENKFDLIAVIDLNTVPSAKIYSDSFSCPYPDIDGELSINPAVGLYDEAQVEGTLVKVPLFEIWAFEKQ